MKKLKLGTIIRQSFKRVQSSLLAQARFSFHYSHALTPSSGAAIIVAILLSYLFERNQGDLYFDTFILRVLVAFVVVLMIFRSYWLPKFFLSPYVVWLFFVAVILPYCFGTILIFDAALAPGIYSINLITFSEYVLSSFFLIQILFHTPLVILIWTLGTIAAFAQLLFLEQPNIEAVVQTFFFVLPFFATALLVGGIINKRLFDFQREKEQAVWNVANAIAHQLRTPLATIKNLAKGSEKEMPRLTRAYSSSIEHGIIESRISKQRLAILHNSLASIQEEVKHSSALIDILIANSKPFHTQAAQRINLDITEVTLRAIREFPYNNSDERELIKFTSSHTFSVYSNESMLLHVMFNLISNGIEFCQKREGGEIKIWLSSEENWNKLFFWDSGVGVPQKYLLSIFEPFVSINSPNGTGIGLSFCKSVMEGLGGDIICSSTEGEFCQFTLFFPKDDDLRNQTP